MRRREFITLLGGAAAAWPLAARAQQPAKLPTIGFLGATTPSAESQRIAAFVQRLRELGWIEGRTVAIEVSLGGGTQRALRRDRGRVRPAEGRCHCHGGNRSGRRGKAGDIGHPDRLRGGGRPGRHRPGREPGATGRQRHRPVDPGDRSCRQATRTFARGCPRSPPVGDHGQCRQSRRRAGDARGSGSGPHARPRGRHIEIRRAEDIAPAFEALKGRADALYVVCRPARNHQPDSHQHLGAGRATADDARPTGERRSGRSDVLWTKLPGPVPARRRLCRQDSARERSRPTCRSSSRPSSSWSSTSRPPRRSASPCHRRCSPAPTR